VVKWDGGDEMVADVSADDVVEKMGIDEAEIAVDGGSGATREGPGTIAVVGKRAVGVLEEGDCHYEGTVISNAVRDVKGEEWVQHKGCDEVWDDVIGKVK
jgi:hypothetical protein